MKVVANNRWQSLSPHLETVSLVSRVYLASALASPLKPGLELQ